MRFKGLYIPDLIAEEVMGPLYEGRAVPVVKKTGDKDQPPAPTSDPTNKILWVGALTSVGGLGIQFADYMRKNKR